MSEADRMIPFPEALETVDRALAQMALPAETVPIGEARGRILVEDQASRLDLPPFNKSAMDGYALPADDQRQEYRILETVSAGDVPSSRLQPGTAVKIMTGAPLPEGAGKVIRQERTAEADGVVRIDSPEKSSNICYQGEDCRRGEVILHSPTMIGPVEIANLISCGIADVPVAARPRAAILATGDEIVDSPDDLGPGKIMNSNGPMLGGLCAQYGMEVVINRIVADRPEETVSAIGEALDAADLVVLSGGVSVGQFDFVGASLGEVGLTTHFSRVAVKPGKPITFATAPGKAVFGLPGNPVSVYVTYYVFVLRAVRLMVGIDHELHSETCPLDGDFRRRRADRDEFVPCEFTERGSIAPVDFHGSGHLLALLDTDGFIFVPAGVDRLAAGEDVDFVAIQDALI